MTPKSGHPKSDNRQSSSVNSNGGESEAMHFIWQNLSWCYLLRASSFSSCPYFVLISATPSVIPAALCNIGEFKNSLANKMVLFFFLWEPDLLIRFTEHGCWNSCAGATEGWQTDSVVGTGRDGGAARQQWTRTHGWWRIHLESHNLSAFSFSASAFSAFASRWSPSLCVKTPCHPFWGYRSEHLSLCRLCAGWSWGVIHFEIFPRPLGPLRSIWRELFTGTTIPIFTQISHQPGTCDESQTDFSSSCWMGLKRKFMVFEVSAANYQPLVQFLVHNIVVLQQVCAGVERHWYATRLRRCTNPSRPLVHL